MVFEFHNVELDTVGALSLSASLFSIPAGGTECVFLLLHIWGKQLRNSAGSGRKYLVARVIRSHLVWTG